MDVSVEMFEYQMRWLRDNGELVTIEAAISSAGLERNDSYVVTFDDGHSSLWRHALPILAELEIPFLLYVCSAPLDGTRLLHDDPRMPLLSWDEIQEMSKTGLLTIGAHTHTHLNLRGASTDVVEGELATNDGRLQQVTGETPRHFAYPWGIWSEGADAAVRSRYATAAVGGGPGLDPESDLHRLYRVPVMGSDDRFLFRRRMWGGFRLETGLRDMRDALRWRDRDR
jgi:peptidoglycan/xylan/chitin deacetylase (PgdA/CDA1 family)